MDFAVQTDDLVETKESEKSDKYFTWELRKLWNIRVTVTVPSTPTDLDRGLEELEVIGRIETTQTTAFLKNIKRPGDLKRLTATKTPVKNN